MEKRYEVCRVNSSGRITSRETYYDADEAKAAIRRNPAELRGWTITTGRNGVDSEQSGIIA